MILKQFPELEWLRHQARTNFADQTGVAGVKLPDKGWPTVVINTRSSGTERNDIAGPFSVFANLEGRSSIRTEGLNLSVRKGIYGITNSGQHYDLVIPERSTTVTFNTHFGQRLFRETVYALRQRDSSFLDRPFCDGGITFETFPRTVWMDDVFKWWIGQLSSFYANQDQYMSAAETEKEMLSSFLEHVLRCDNSELDGMQSIPSLKRSTREELMKRILRAVEFIHDRYTAEITLDDLSQVSGLSKFHLQRTFKQARGRTPQQYIAWLRLQKAFTLMENTRLPLSDISLATGFSELAAFSRFFVNQTKIYPSAYREKLARRVK